MSFHNNPSLSLSGEAENFVNVMLMLLHITEYNYEIMWQILNKRYHNNRSIVSVYIGKLLNQKKIRTESAKSII